MDKNPYVGPRAYREGEKLYGRLREARDILGLFIAERAVLIYSPSGAGKTSLIEAGLVPQLQKRFEVLPRVRVGLELPGTRGTNRYDHSAFVSLAGQRPFTLWRPLGNSPSGLLASYLAARPGNDARRGTVLIFDQFEEILTLSASDTDAKEEFFRQIGTVLENRNVWALFAIREEYIGALEPYLSHIPGRLSTRYRLELLGPDAATDAIRRPAQNRGVRFTTEALKLLVDDLRLMKEMGADGEPRDVTGPVIEPVHLQVVCQRLWEKLGADQLELDPEGKLLIDVPQVQSIGSVASVLRRYYRELVQEVANSPEQERAIRQWIGTQLITARRFRNQVMREGRRTAGLDEGTIDRLTGLYLVRREERRGLVWYELAHDRLIEPVCEDNAEWFEENATELQRLAEFWFTHGRPKRMLLRGEAIDEALALFKRKNIDLTPVELEFLDASRQADEKARRRRSRVAWLTRGTGSAILVVAAALGGIAWSLSGANVELRNDRSRLQTQAGTLQATTVVLEQRSEGQDQSRDTLEKYIQLLLEAKSRTERQTARVRLNSILEADQIIDPVRRNPRQSLQPPRDTAVIVRYFARDRDVALVEAALRPLRYPLERKVSTAGGGVTNEILYGDSVLLDDVRRVALALVAAGVPIKRIVPRGEPRTTSNEIRIRGRSDVESFLPLTAESIQALGPSRRIVGPSYDQIVAANEQVGTDPQPEDEPAEPTRDATTHAPPLAGATPDTNKARPSATQIPRSPAGRPQP